jgi:hypothetical protein
VSKRGSVFHLARSILGINTLSKLAKSKYVVLGTQWCPASQYQEAFGYFWLPSLSLFFMLVDAETPTPRPKCGLGSREAALRARSLGIGVGMGSQRRYTTSDGCSAASDVTRGILRLKFQNPYEK